MRVTTLTVSAPGAAGARSASSAPPTPMTAQQQHRISATAAIRISSRLRLRFVLHGLLLPTRSRAGQHAAAVAVYPFRRHVQVQMPYRHIKEGVRAQTHAHPRLVVRPRPHVLQAHAQDGERRQLVVQIDLAAGVDGDALRVAARTGLGGGRNSGESSSGPTINVSTINTTANAFPASRLGSARQARAGRRPSPGSGPDTPGC